MTKILEFSITPAPRLVYAWKFIIGLIWAITIFAVSNIGVVKEEFYSLIAVFIAIGFGNFVMLSVLLLTSAVHKDVEVFITDTMDVGNASLIALAVGSLLFMAIESIVPLRVSLMVVSITSSLVMGSVVVYMSTKLLNGNYLRVGSSNMLSVLVQTAIMYGVLFILGY